MALLVLSAALAPGCALRGRGGPTYVDQAKQMWREGVAALESGQVGEAESWLRRAAEATPDDAATQLHLAEALWRGGQRDEACRRAEEACRFDPRNAQAAVRAGEMRLALGNADLARQWADHAIACDGRSAGPWALRGKAYVRLGESDRAVADLQQALRYAPADAAVLADLVSLHGARGDHRRRLTTAHHLLDAYPPGQEPATALGLAADAYLALGRPRDAADTLQIAANRGDADADLFAKLAEARAAAGDAPAALADAERALAIDAAHAGSRELIARLRPTEAPLLR